MVIHSSRLRYIKCMHLYLYLLGFLYLFLDCISPKASVQVEMKQQAVTRKAEEALDGLCGRRFT